MLVNTYIKREFTFAVYHKWRHAVYIQDQSESSQLQADSDWLF